MSPLLSPDERIARIRLASTPNIGPKTFLELIKCYGSAVAAIQKLPDISLKGGRENPLVAASVETAALEEEALAAAGGRFIVLGEKNYPALLAQIEDPPIVISYIGQFSLLEPARSRVAIVGTRAASSNGLRFADTLSAHIAEQGHVIVSGMARGIDGAAHQAALNAKGGTIAVLAGGVNHIYPSEHRELYHRLTEQGGVMAEGAFGTAPIKSSFVRRNRIISGLCYATVVVEADVRSGSLSTAKFAADQNREVCAVPGFPLDPRCHGANDLLKQGAHPVTCAQDVLNILPASQEMRENAPLGFIAAPCAPLSETEIDDAREKVRRLLSGAPESMEDIAAHAGVSLRAASVIILEMELAGKIERRRGNKVALIY